MRYVVVRASLRPGERMLRTAEGVRLLEWNLGRRKCRYDSVLFAYRIDAGGIELVLGLPTPERLKKIMHRIRIFTVTQFNRGRGVVGTQRWKRGFLVQELDRAQIAREARRVGRPRHPRVVLDPLPGDRRRRPP